MQDLDWTIKMLPYNKCVTMETDVSFHKMFFIAIWLPILSKYNDLFPFHPTVLLFLEEAHKVEAFSKGLSI
jgi:hypothetical protein